MTEEEVEAKIQEVAAGIKAATDKYVGVKMTPVIKSAMITAAQKVIDQITEDMRKGTPVEHFKVTVTPTPDDPREMNVRLEALTAEGHQMIREAKLRMEREDQLRMERDNDQMEDDDARD